MESTETSINRWIKKTYYKFIKEYYSAIKKYKILPFVAKCRLSRDNHAKWSTSERDRQIPYIIHLWNLKNDINEFIYQTELDL